MRIETNTVYDGLTNKEDKLIRDFIKKLGHKHDDVMYIEILPQHEIKVREVRIIHD